MNVSKLAISFPVITITLQAATKETEGVPLGLWVAIAMLIVLLIIAPRSKRTGLKDTKMDENEGIAVDEKAPKRIQHYKFSHEFLRDFFFEDRDALIRNILRKEGGLQELWNDVGRYYAENFEGVQELDASTIAMEAKEYNDTLYVAIQLPEPKKRAEAYFVGLIMPNTDINAGRYITLEYGDDEEIGKYTVLCEWKEDTHLNYGEGCEPTMHDFKNTLIGLDNESVKSWDEAVTAYSGEEWMQTLWKWADEYDISPLVFPRNNIDLQTLEELVLDFEDKKPEYLPKEIGNLVNLHTFVMRYSKIKELPDEFSNLVNLKYLYLDGNELTKLPEAFCALVKLEYISLSYNSLTSLPDCIGELQHLVSVNLNINLLKELPESMSKLKLKELRLLDNPVEYISKEVQEFLNTTRKADASAKEPFTIVWKFGEEIHEYVKQFNIHNFDGSLPFFLSGKEVESDDGFLLTQRHLLLGILYGLNRVEELPIYTEEKVLIGLVDTLSEGYGFETIEEMVLDASPRVRNINGSHPSRLMLEAAKKLVPGSSQIKEHLILDLWSEISNNEDNIELLEEIPALVKEIDLTTLHSYSKQLVCYYGLCALIFIHRNKHEDYLENDLVDEYLKMYFYTNVTDALLLNKAEELMKNPEKFQPIDLWSPMT